MRIPRWFAPLEKPETREPITYTIDPDTYFPNISLLSGRPAHPGGCYHCQYGARQCFCPGVGRTT